MTAGWIRLKCGLREEFVVGGYNDASGARTGLASLLPGTYDPKGRLIYAGSVGIGIERGFLSHVFELFAQGKRSSARSEGGLGLGLSLVKSIVELHGGTVRAASEGLGRGARFTVLLPELVLDAAPTAPLIVPPVLALPSASIRVLVVDDNVDAAEVMAALVQAFGHVVDTAHDARKALELAEKIKFDACLLDIGLPGEIDGNELAKRLRTLPTTREALLVAVTGYGHVNDRAKGVASGFDHYFVKPVNVAKIIELCAEHASRRT